MLDPISLIVVAMVNGAMAAVSKATEDGTTRAYVRLKSAILTRHGADAGDALHGAVAALEQQPESAAVQARLAAEFERVGVDRDAYLRDLAEPLVSLVEDPMQRFSTATEEAQFRGGASAVAHVLDRHVGDVLTVREHYEVDDLDLLTSPNARAGAGVPEPIRGEISQLHQRIGSLIEQIAQRIEDTNYREAEASIQSMPMAYVERERARALVRADKRLHVSFLALRMTVEYLGEINQRLLTRIEDEASPIREANMMFGNALLIYELTSFVIGYVESFRLDGEADIRRLYAQTNNRIEQLRDEQDRLQERATRDDIESAVRTQTLEDVRSRAAAIDAIEQEWGKYLAEVDDAQSMIGTVHAKLPTLELIRDSARVQIRVLQLVAMMQFLRSNAAAVQGAMATLGKLRLARLSPNRVRRLIGADE